MRPRIIILEDDEVIRLALNLLLRKRGYEVIEASEPLLCPIYIADDGVCDHEHACGDVLIADNCMPSMTGLQFVTHQTERGCKGAVRNKAIISGNWTDTDLEIAARLGCKVFHKPCRIQEIYDWIEERLATIPPDRRLADLGAG